jgi:DNA-binding transcriptional ArsR family regulator
VVVRFAFPPDRPSGLIGFGWSPLNEAALSLRSVVRPTRFPFHLPWARRCRGLPTDLLDELHAIAGPLDGMIPGVFEVGLGHELGTFEQELARFAAVDLDLFAYEFSLAYGGTGCAPRDHDQSIVHDPDYARAVVASARTCDPGMAAIVEATFADPDGMRGRVTAMMERYWDLAFRDEWERVRPRIEAELTDAARLLVTGGVSTLVTEFLPEARWDEDRSILLVDKRYDRTSDVEAAGGVLLVPTVYGWPSVLVELDAPWPLAIFFPLRELRHPEVPDAADHEVADGLRALGDETRLQITRMVSQEPRSTKELATLLSLSESAVSRHLKILDRAGVVTGERDGYFVLYRLVPERIGTLGAALRRTLGLTRAPTGATPALPVDIARRPELARRPPSARGFDEGTQPTSSARSPD